MVREQFFFGPMSQGSRFVFPFASRSFGIEIPLPQNPMDELHDWNAGLSRIRATRTLFARLFEATPIEKWDRIPPGHRNDMLWNYGHAIVTCSLLVYRPAGMEPSFSEERLNAYRKGSSPEQRDKQHSPIEEYRLLTALGEQDLERILDDARSGRFVQFASYQTSYGMGLNSSLEALLFDAQHEALHLGVATAQAKSLSL